MPYSLHVFLHHIWQHVYNTWCQFPLMGIYLYLVSLCTHLQKRFPHDNSMSLFFNMLNYDRLKFSLTFLVVVNSSVCVSQVATFLHLSFGVSFKSWLFNWYCFPIVSIFKTSLPIYRCSYIPVSLVIKDYLGGFHILQDLVCLLAYYIFLTFNSGIHHPGLLWNSPFPPKYLTLTCSKWLKVGLVGTAHFLTVWY